MKDLLKYHRATAVLIIAMLIVSMVLVACSDSIVEMLPSVDNNDSSDNSNNDPQLPEYTITYETNGGTALSDATYSGQIVDTAMPIRDGYNFVSWYLDDQLTEQLITPYDLTQDTVLYAQWMANTDGLEYTLADDGYSVSGVGTTLDNGIVSIVVPQYVGGTPVVSVGEYAFMCKDIVSIVLPSGIVSVGGYAFCGCSQLCSVQLPNTLDSIGTMAFFHCSSLTEVELPSSLTSIGQVALSGCSSITELVVPDSVATIGNGAFSDCTSFASIVLPADLTLVPVNMLAGCSSLTSVDIPDSVTHIGFYALSRCTSLTTLTLPSSLATLAQQVVDGCTSLQWVQFADSNNWYYTDDYNYVNGTAIDVSNQYDNVSLLTDSLVSAYWYKA